MRYLFGIMCLLALGIMGCSDPEGAGGSGGSAGDGGSGGSGVACVDNVCPCNEAGIRGAIAKGGGPFTFDCNGPTTVSLRVRRDRVAECLRRSITSLMELSFSMKVSDWGIYASG